MTTDNRDMYEMEKYLIARIETLTRRVKELTERLRRADDLLARVGDHDEKGIRCEHE